jgi:hypothetical protein
MTGSGRLASATGGPFAAVIGRLEEAVREWYGPGARLVPGTPVRHRPWSVHLLPTVTTPEREIRLVVKVPIWDEAPDLEAAIAAGPQAATLAEFETLRRIEAMVAGDTRFAAVRAVGHLRDCNALVTERMEGVPLRALRRGRSAALERLGALARRFHEEIGGARVVTGDQALAARMAAGLAPPSDTPASLAAAGEAARRSAAGLAGRRIRLAVTHGDLGPSNVLVTPDGRVALLDPNMVEAPVEDDLAKLAVALRTSRLRLASGRPGGRRFPPEEALLAGYGDYDADIYRSCRRIAAVRRWIEIETSTGLLHRMLRRPARRVLRREAA